MWRTSQRPYSDFEFVFLALPSLLLAIRWKIFVLMKRNLLKLFKLTFFFFGVPFKENLPVWHQIKLMKLSQATPSQCSCRSAPVRIEQPDRRKACVETENQQKEGTPVEGGVFFFFFFTLRQKANQICSFADNSYWRKKFSKYNGEEGGSGFVQPQRKREQYHYRMVPLN